MISTKIRREFKLVYRDPESNYSALDFTGTGKISIRTFLDNVIVKRLKLDEEDIIKWLIRDKIFPDRNSEIDFQQLKIKFFPEYYLIEDVNEYEINDHKKEDQILFQDACDKNITHHYENSQGDKKKIVVQRLQDLELQLKHRFQHNWESVRRAFLDLDYDHDGFITSQDIIRYFGQGSKDIDFNDLTKLMKDKDSKKKGYLSYADFSSWMGVVIHQSEGFYFRHDSIKNPPFEGHQQVKQEKLKTKSGILSLDVEKTVIDKIRFQWKTLKKAFIDLNKEKTGSIMPMELKNYLKHWGIYLNEEQFKLLFDKFDSDKDGKITYEDFQNTVGNEINPPEHLYFRQDMRRIPRPVACKNEDCLQPPTAVSEYCQMHIKMMQNKSIKIIQRIRTQLGIKWPQLLNNIQRQADKDDENLIYLDKFVDILQRIYQIELSQEDQNLILNGFIAKSIEKQPKINISHILQLQNTSKIKKLYKQIDLNEEEQEDAQFVDMSGYFGKFYRQNVKLNQITIDEFVNVIVKDNKLASIMRCIKQIDKDNNGYVTNQELDDILKYIYPEQFGDKDLKRLFRTFSSIQNTILIDYKKLRDFLLQKINESKQKLYPDHIHHEKSNDKEKSFDKKELNYINYVLDKQQRFLISQEPLYKKSMKLNLFANKTFNPNQSQSSELNKDQISIKYVHSLFDQKKTEDQVKNTIQAQSKIQPALIGNRD
ncbi:ef-hand calcium-binding domain-containing protein 6 [Stylonychia lemnae]|uniref:Ef-hand calcium-binding domain-containing protein 6 n=1 Tax=Stylonychia lemnae TaxID=5949 RepID=A0A077ZZ06_STYLE|nr:ef-hand calcium-binding domain-containing protein 6 [Stylonychia lemnae]|eukprot:CDW74423.1 ef-hand calcium-binding domain-containing protein 6 [Stylonychia lemnae]